MEIILNEYKYIVGFLRVGSFGDNGFSVNEHDIPKDNLSNYQYIEGRFVLNKPKDKPMGVNLVYDGSEWIEKATQHELISAQYSTEEKILELEDKIAKRKAKKFSFQKEELELTMLESRLNYINRKILVKL